MTSWGTKGGVAEALECSLALGDVAKTQELLGIIDALRPGELTPIFRGIRARFRACSLRRPAAPTRERTSRRRNGSYEGLGTPFFLAVTQLEHAEWLAAQGENDDAAALQSAAREVFDRLGAVPWLERADRLQLGTEVSS